MIEQLESELTCLVAIMLVWLVRAESLVRSVRRCTTTTWQCFWIRTRRTRQGAVRTHPTQAALADSCACLARCCSVRRSRLSKRKWAEGRAWSLMTMKKMKSFDTCFGTIELLVSASIRLPLDRCLRCSSMLKASTVHEIHELISARRPADLVALVLFLMLCEWA
jgi:hypothetical protein